MTSHGGVPTEAVSQSKGVCWVDQDAEIRRHLFIGGELLGALLDLLRRAGVDEDHSCAARLKVLGVLEKITELSRAERALITGPASQQHEDDRTVRELRRECHGASVQSRKRKVGGLVANARRNATSRCRDVRSPGRGRQYQ